MNSAMLALLKIETMSSLTIAELTGKRHDNVLRDIEKVLAEVEIDVLKFEGYYFGENNRQQRCYHLPRRECDLLVSGYNAKYRLAIIDRWQYLEDQLRIVQLRTGTKKHQLEAMEALSRLLPDDLSKEELSYIKANTVVNKAVSNLFGFPKMLKKDEMSDDMIEVRGKVLDDYLKLYEVLEDNGKVKELLYDKYQPKRIEDTSVKGNLKLVGV